MEEVIQEKVYIIIQHNNVFLVNQLEESIEEVVYSTYAVATYDEQIGVSSIPHYRIKNIPPNHIVHLETLDGWDDGTVYYELVSIQLINNTLNINQVLKQKKRSGLAKLPPKIDCSIEKIVTKNGFSVELD